MTAIDMPARFDDQRGDAAVMATLRGESRKGSRFRERRPSAPDYGRVHREAFAPAGPAWSSGLSTRCYPATRSSDDHGVVVERAYKKQDLNHALLKTDSRSARAFSPDRPHTGASRAAGCRFAACRGIGGFGRSRYRPSCRKCAGIDGRGRPLHSAAHRPGQKAGQRSPAHRGRGFGGAA